MVELEVVDADADADAEADEGADFDVDVDVSEIHRRVTLSVIFKGLPTDRRARTPS